MPPWARKPEGAELSSASADTLATQQLLVSIFSPAHRALASPTTADGGNVVKPAVSSSNNTVTASASPFSSAAPPKGTPPFLIGRNGGRDAGEDPSPWWATLRRWQPSTWILRSTEAPASETVRSLPTYGADTNPTAPHGHRDATSEASDTAAASYRTITDCPLAGYQLTDHGLVDRLMKPPHTLTAKELRSLIKELTILEQQAKYDVDRQFTSHMGSRSLHGLELLISPALMLTSIYLMTWKTAQLYHNAVPRNSVLFTQLLALFRLHMPVERRELVAQRHRRLMRATNARVSLSFVSGVGLFTLACVSWPSANIMEEAPDVQTAKELIAYQRHSEALLKWCWFVYYHHPAYLSSDERR